MGNKRRTIRKTASISDLTQKVEHMKRARIMSLFSVLVTLIGCGPGLKSRGPISPALPQPSGLRYNLAKDVVVLSGTVTWAITGSVSIEGGSISEEAKFPISTKREYVSTTVQTSLATIGDTSAYYVLKVEPAGFKDQTLGIGVNDSGILTSVNFTATDKTGEAITNIGKSIASVAGAFFGFGGRAASVHDLRGTFRKLIKDDPALLGNNPPADLQAWLEDKFSKLPPDIAYFVTSDRSIRVAWFSAARNERAESEQRNLIAQATLDAATETDENRLKKLVQQISFRNTSADMIDKQLKSDQSTLDAAIEKARSAAGLGRQEYTRPIDRTLELSELPPFSLASMIADKQVSQVSAALGDYPAAKALFDDAQIVITLEKPGFSNAVPTAPLPTTMPKEDKVSRIYYRPTYPAVIRTFGLRKISIPAAMTAPIKPAETRDVVVLLTQASVQVADPRIAPSWVEYDPKAFSNQNLTLGFNAKGQLISATQGATSSIAGAAAGVAGALAGTRDEFATSLSKAKDIISTKQQIELSDLDFKIGELTKRKSLIDQRLALAGATTNYDLLLEKQEVDQQLALLQSQQNLVKAQQSSDATLSAAKTAADVAALTQQVQLLQQQIELLKQRKALDDLKNPANP
jgi:hypothetical protein